MVRKWAIAYEKITGDSVRLRSKRDGREFSTSQVDIISAAKKYVDYEGVKVETALKMALGQTELVPVALYTGHEGSDSLEVLKEFLVLSNETTQLLLEEIRGLRQDLSQTPAENKNSSAPVEQSSPVENKPHGLLVRLAIRLESWVRR
jgi:hypothetical protein